MFLFSELSHVSYCLSAFLVAIYNQHLIKAFVQIDSREKSNVQQTICMFNFDEHVTMKYHALI